MKRPVNTLFMLMSVDGKISTGVTDERHVDKDYKKIAGIKEGLAQYYEKEKINYRIYASRIIVTGPSLTSSTCIIAPNLPSKTFGYIS